jgi:hypothetical protein
MPRLTHFRSMSKLALLFLVFICELEAAAATCPAPAKPPGHLQSIVTKQPRALDPYSISQTVDNYYDAPLGLGLLEVTEESGQHYYDWMFELELPVWSAPNAERPLGWVMRGKIYSDTGVETLTGAGMVETDYEQTSFIVWETQEAWFKLRLANDLDVWTHRCHLETTKFKLEHVPWQKFLRQHSDWLHFRKPVPHILRVSPSVNSERVATIGLDHKLILLDIRGDWMEVAVEQPDLTCSGDEQDESRSSQHRGWVKWRDERGPWVYIYTRGC